MDRVFLRDIGIGAYFEEEALKKPLDRPVRT